MKIGKFDIRWGDKFYWGYWPFSFFELGEENSQAVRTLFLGFIYISWPRKEVTL